MQTLSTLAMCDAIAAKILTITPTVEALRDVRWSFTPAARAGGRATLEPATRNFDLIFGGGVPSYLWVGGTGTAYKLRLAVATSYAGCAPEILEHLLTGDGVDLRRALEQLRDPTLPGFVNVEPLGIQNERVDSEANVYVEHAFTVHYHQATA